MYASAPALAQGTSLEGPISIPYLTIRNQTEDEDPEAFYGEGRGRLSSGWCDIETTGLGLLTPAAEAVTFHIPDEILRVTEIRPQPVASILGGFETAGVSPILYIHGFNIDFSKGCRRATVLSQNASLAERFLWFSWPSNGSLVNYPDDEADLYWSVPDLADVIIDLAEQFGSSEVDLVGHSLGARGLALALVDVAGRSPETRFGQIALLAPDMDFEIFQKFLPRILPLAQGITVYTADKDRPLAISAQYHGYARLGETGNDVERLSGVDVIDLSKLPVRSASGHLYHLYNPQVGNDLNQLLFEGLPAASRRNLKQVGVNHWAFQPVE